MSSIYFRNPICGGKNHNEQCQRSGYLVSKEWVFIEKKGFEVEGIWGKFKIEIG